jgi:hypothetical protein
MGILSNGLESGGFKLESHNRKQSGIKAHTHNTLSTNVLVRLE